MHVTTISCVDVISANHDHSSFSYIVMKPFLSEKDNNYNLCVLFTS